MSVSYKSEQKLYKFEQTVQANGVNASISILMMTQITQVQQSSGKIINPLNSDKPKSNAPKANLCTAKPKKTSQNTPQYPNFNWFSKILPASQKPATEKVTEYNPNNSQSSATSSKSPPKWFYSEDTITDVDMNFSKKTQSKKPIQSSHDVWYTDSKYSSWA